LLASELKEIQAMGFDLALTGFAVSEIDELLVAEPQDLPAPPPPANPASRPDDLWLLGPHRVICGDATDANVVARLLGDCRPILMVTDPPYGVQLDSEWRDRAGLNGGNIGGKRTVGEKARAAADPRHHAEPSYMKRRTPGHTETSISGDTRADWSDVFALVPSLQVAYVWHASKYTHEVLDGLLRIGFEHHQQSSGPSRRSSLPALCIGSSTSRVGSCASLTRRGTASPVERTRPSGRPRRVTGAVRETIRGLRRGRTQVRRHSRHRDRGFAALHPGCSGGSGRTHWAQEQVLCPHG
jgi:hypothetical protein